MRKGNFKKCMVFILFLTFGIYKLAAFTTFADSKTVTFKFDNFSSNTDQLQINGDAAVADAYTTPEATEVSNGKVLRVCPSVTYNHGSVFNKNKISLSSNRSFSTYFEFNINNGVRNRYDDAADGFVFVMQTQSNNVGGNAGGLGYAGVANSLGIEFDTYNNGSDNGDSDANHIAIDENGDVSKNYGYIGNPGGWDINDGSNYHVWIDYDGSHKKLEIRLNKGSNVRPANPVLSADSIDLNSILGSDDIYAGFTAATGGAWQNHDILKWYFNNNYDPIDITQNTYVQTPTSVTLASAANPASPVLSKNITAQVKNADGSVASNVNVDFTTDFGTLKSSSAVTDSNGNATVTLDSSTGGTANIKAVALGGAYSNLSVTFSEPDLTFTPVANDQGNYIGLSWTNSNTSQGYHYMVTKKDLSVAGSTAQTIPLKSTSKVLNVYPGGGTPMNGYTDLNGNTIDTSGSVKAWMDGFGKGLITIDSVYIDEFSNNPDIYLKDSNGNYKYDVVFIGAWDSNNNKDISIAAKNSLQAFIDAGGGYLAGHDTADPCNNRTVHPQLCSLAENNLNVYLNEYIPFYGSTGKDSTIVVNVIKKGMLTNYPWTLSSDSLTVPESHSTHELAMGDIWMNYTQNKIDGSGPVTSYDGHTGTSNFYLTTWNNTAMIQTGHSNGNATDDEQKVLANTLLYLSQVSTDTSFDDHTAQDVTAPNAVSNIGVTVDAFQKANIKFDQASDNGDNYEYQLKAIGNTDNKIYTSGTVQSTITSGIKGYAVMIDQNESTDPGNTVNTTSAAFTSQALTDGTWYVHVNAVDNAGNVSSTQTKSFIVSAHASDGGSVKFETIDEDTGEASISGISVSDILSLNGTNVGSDTLGIAITSVDKNNGYWEYVVGGKWWTLAQDGLDFSEKNALLLSGDTKIKFIPSADFNGTASIKFHVWNGTLGTSNTREDVTTNDGITAFSSSQYSADAVVNAVNDAPSILKNPNNSEILHFDGTLNSNVSVSDMKLNDSFTVGAWVKIEAANNFSRIFDFGSPEAGGYGNNIWLGFDGSTGKMEFEVWNGSNRDNSRHVITTDDVPLNQWMYVTAVYDQQKQMGYIYWNGKLKASGTMDVPYSGTVIRSSNYWGRSNWAEDAPYKGSMSNMAVWNTARDQDQIITDMNAKFTGSEANLVAYYPTTEGSGTAINDLSANKNNGTLSSTGVAWAVNKDFVYYVTGNMNSDIKVNQILIKDIDVQNGNMLLDLSAGHGNIAFENSDGLTFKSGKNGDSSIEVQGTIDAINSALANLKYHPETNYTGDDTINVKICDMGNTGLGNQAGLTDSKTVSVNILPSPEAGFGNALKFNGSDFISISNGGIKLGQSFTEEAWIYPTETSSGEFHGFIGNEVDTAHYEKRAPGLWTVSKSKIHGGFGDGSNWGDSNTVTPDNVLKPDTWNHVAATYDGSVYKIYVNGNLVLSQKFDKTSLDTPVTTIGKVDSFFNGYMDEVRLWKTALSQDTIRNYMNREIDPGHPDYQYLAGYWQFDESTGTATKDSKNNDLDNFAGSPIRCTSTIPQRYYVNSGASIPVYLIGYDENGKSLTYQIVTGPSHGTITGYGSNRTYINNGDAVKTDTITYKVNDGINDSVNTATIEIIVNQKPVISDFSKIGNKDDVVAFSQSDFTGHFSDTEHEILQQIRITDISGLNGTLKIGNTDVTSGSAIQVSDLDSLTFVPNTNWKGSTSFKWTAYDGYEWSDAAVLTINIGKLADIVLTSSSTVEGGAAVSISSTGDSTNSIWLAPDGTTSFVEGTTMTKATGAATTINAPKENGDYKLYVVDAAGSVSEASTETITVDNTNNEITEGKNLLTDASILGGNSSLDNITSNMTFPTNGADGTSIIWSSSPAGYVNTTTGAITAPSYSEGDKKVTLMATISKAGGVSQTKEFTATLKATAETSDESIASGKNSLTEASILNGNSSLDNITNSMTFPTSGADGTSISWSSSPAGYVNTTTGAITAPSYSEGDKKVTLTATISKAGGESQTKEFTTTVKAASETADESITAGKTDLTETSILNGNSSLDNITKDMTFPIDGADGTSISWSSSPAGYVNTTTGAITASSYSEGDKKVTLTATISKAGGVSQTKEFTATVKAAGETADESITTGKNSLTETSILNGNSSLDNITKNMTFPTSGTDGTSISWSSSPAGYVNTTTGAITAPGYAEGDKKVTLTARISKAGGVSQTKEFTATVKAASQPTNGGGSGSGTGGSNIPSSADSSITSEKNNLTDVSILGDNRSLDNITSGMTFPTSGTDGTSISWNSSPAGYVNTTTGAITAPGYSEGDKKVTLTATISKAGGVSQTKEFTVTVKAVSETADESISAGKTGLTETSILGGNSSLDNITKDMTFPTSGADGTSISWSSSPAGYVNTTTGAITALGFTEGDKKVTLIATISKAGGASQTKEFKITIKAANQPTSGGDSGSSTGGDSGSGSSSTSSSSSGTGTSSDNTKNTEAGTSTNKDNSTNGNVSSNQNNGSTSNNSMPTFTDAIKQVVSDTISQISQSQNGIPTVSNETESKIAVDVQDKIDTLLQSMDAKPVDTEINSQKGAVQIDIGNELFAVGNSIINTINSDLSSSGGNQQNLQHNVQSQLNLSVIQDGDATLIYSKQNISKEDTHINVDNLKDYTWYTIKVDVIVNNKVVGTEEKRILTPDRTAPVIENVTTE